MTIYDESTPKFAYEIESRLTDSLDWIRLSDAAYDTGSKDSF